MSPVPRGYHHGDLHETAIRIGLDAARTQGVAGVTVREVTRRVGVSPNALYRHFEDHRALVVAVALAAQGHLVAAMEARIADLTTDVKGPDAALGQLRGVGLGYIDFALTEPGWFELALLTFDPNAGGAPAVRVGEDIPPPFRMLMGALDGMVDAGLLSPAQREHAEWPCWSAVHGFADIATRGPLQGADPAMLAALGGLVVDRIIAGIGAQP